MGRGFPEPVVENLVLNLVVVKLQVRVFKLKSRERKLFFASVFGEFKTVQDNITPASRMPRKLMPSSFGVKLSLWGKVSHLKNLRNEI